MEEKIEQTSTAVTGLPGLKGRWRLSYKMANPKTNVFGGKGLGSYTNPRTGQIVPLIDFASRKIRPQYILDKVVKLIYPERSMQELKDLEWLIHNPKIYLEGYDKIGPEWIALKEQNTPWKLEALDYKEFTEYENEEFIDKLVGRISLDGGKDAIGLDRLKLLLSAMGKPYRSNRYAHDDKKEKAYLRSKLKAYVRSDMKIAKEVAGLLENNRFENNQGEYYVKEMVRLGLLTYTNGMYKYDGSPLAATHIGIMEIWAVEPGTKEQHLSALKKAQELELFKK